MPRIADKPNKFRGGVRYYHRSAAHGPPLKAALDWRTREVVTAREKRRRVVRIVLGWLGLLALVATVFAMAAG